MTLPFEHRATFGDVTVIYFDGAEPARFGQPEASGQLIISHPQAGEAYVFWSRDRDGDLETWLADEGEPDASSEAKELWRKCDWERAVDEYLGEAEA